MKITIECKDGMWLVNDKRLAELNEFESRFMNDFFREVKMYTESDMKHFNAFNHFKSDRLQGMTSEKILKEFNEWKKN